MSVPWLLNTAWMLKCAPEAAAFARACHRAAETQGRLLRQTLWTNRNTEFGRAHGFADITSVRAYQERVPLTSYDDLAAQMERIAGGQANVLTAEPVRLLEPTSGTTGGEKLIPYTAGLRRQFQRGVAAWVFDLFRHHPAVRGGRGYWSVSPQTGPPRRSPGGLPIGFEDDAAYLGRAEQVLLRRLLVAPAEVARLSDMDAWRYATLRCLLAADDLTLISVWSPTVLPALLAPLERWQERLCFDLGCGTLSPPVGPPGPAGLRWRADPVRAEEVSRVLRSRAGWAERLCRLWPRLALISCWGDAAAARFLPELRTLFPEVQIQPKGLLATEGFVSLPLTGLPGAALALRCHFFEFQEEDGGRCRLAHEVERGGRYRMVLTTAGGLYRYQLRDEVEVVGLRHQCPLLRFVGKADAVSDLVGEKLAEPHVRAVLDRVAADRALRPTFALLVPVLDRPPRYRLYIQGPGLGPASTVLDALRAELQAGLNENPYYRHAVAVGQLAPVEVAALDPGGEPGWRLYERRCLAEGQKYGNIKPASLDPRPGWPEWLAPLEGEPAGGRR